MTSWVMSDTMCSPGMSRDDMPQQLTPADGNVMVDVSEDKDLSLGNHQHNDDTEGASMETQCTDVNGLLPQEAAWLMHGCPVNEEGATAWRECHVGRLLIPAKVGLNGADNPHPIRRTCWFSAGEGQWLNYTMFNAQVLWLREREEISWKENGVLVLPSCFLPILKQLRETKERTGTVWFNSRELLAGLSLRSLKQVILPITVGNNTHWVVFVVSWTEPAGEGDENEIYWRIALYDSLISRAHVAELDEWAIFIIEVFMPLLFKKGQAETRCAEKAAAPIRYAGPVRQFPQQGNGYDCGVAALTVIKCLLAGQVVTWDATTASLDRQSYRTNIVSKGYIQFPTPNDAANPKPAKIPRKRREQSKKPAESTSNATHTTKAQKKDKVMFGDKYFDFDAPVMSDGPLLTVAENRSKTFIRMLADFGFAREAERKSPDGGSTSTYSEVELGNRQKNVAAGILKFNQLGPSTKQYTMLCVNAYIAWVSKEHEKGGPFTWIVTSANAALFLDHHCRRTTKSGNIPQPAGDVEKSKGQLMRLQTRGGRGLYSGMEYDVKEVVQIVVQVTKDRPRQEAYLIRARDIRDCPFAAMCLLNVIKYQLMHQGIHWDEGWKSESVFSNMTAACHGDMFKRLQKKAGIELYTPGPDGKATVTHQARKHAVQHSQITGGDMESTRVMGWAARDKMTMCYRNEPEMEHMKTQAGWHDVVEPYHHPRANLDPYAAGFGDLFADPNFLGDYAASVKTAQATLTEASFYDLQANLREADSMRLWILQDVPFLMDAYPPLQTYLEAKSPFFDSDRFKMWSVFARKEVKKMEEEFSASHLKACEEVLHPLKRELCKLTQVVGSILQTTRQRGVFDDSQEAQRPAMAGADKEVSVKLACLQQDVSLFLTNQSQIMSNQSEILNRLERIEERRNNSPTEESTVVMGGSSDVTGLKLPPTLQQKTPLVGSKRSIDLATSVQPTTLITLPSIETTSILYIWDSFKSKEEGGGGWHDLNCEQFSSKTRFYQYQSVARLVAALIYNKEQGARGQCNRQQLVASALEEAGRVKPCTSRSVAIGDAMQIVKDSVEKEELKVGGNYLKRMAPPFKRKPGK